MNQERELIEDMSREDKSSRLYREGREARDVGNYLVAIRRLRQSSRLAPHFKTYELLGECLLKIEKPKDAVLYLAAAAGLGNKQFRAHYLLGSALLLLDPPSIHEAAVHFQEALRLNPNYKTAKKGLEELVEKNEFLRQLL